MFNKYPVLSRSLVFLLLPLLLVVVAAYYYLKQSAPQYHGQVAVKGLTNPVTVGFDSNGIPVVEADSDEAVFFTQGYLHASERMWQMELQRRLVNGRLSEVFGRHSVSSDIWLRTLGLDRAAQASWQSFSESAKAALDAYARGVNAWLKANPKPGAEFLLFEVEPEPWRPVDSLAWQKLFALNLGLNLFDEVNRLAALKQLPGKKLKTFYRHDPDYQGLELLKSRALVSRNSVDEYRFDSWSALAQTFIYDWHIGGKNVGSNSWVISGQYTRSGNPLLSNDPHLTIQQPSPWYAMQLKGDKLDATGMSMVGLPGIILGKNQDIAWGASSLMADQQDLYVLDIPLGGSDVYITEQGPKPLVYREETIHIRPDQPEFLHHRKKPLKIQVRETEFGPVVSDVLSDTDYDLALRWTALEADDRSFEAFFNLQYAADWSSFREALSLLKSPGLHFVYADNHGNIGAQVAAQLPVRGHGHGILPNLAALTGHHWLEFTPFEQLPSQYNPASGFLLAANNEIAAAPGVTISHEWASDSRKDRISQMIQRFIKRGDGLTVEDMALMQNDLVDVGAQSLLGLLSNERLAQLLKNNAPQQIAKMASEAHKLLSQWQGEFTKDSAAASIYFYWREALTKAIYSHQPGQGRLPLLDQTLDQALTSRISEVQLATALEGRSGQWCEPASAAQLPCQQALLSGFYQALRKLKKHSGSNDPEQWQWGRLHHVDYIQKPFGTFKWLDVLYKDTWSVGGSQNTINVANASFDPDGGVTQTFGVTFRHIFEMGQSQTAAYVLPNGQSSHLLSPYYDNMSEAFIAGESYHYGGQGSSTTSLTLVPQE